MRPPVRLSLPDAEEAKTATGYERGTISPFGSSIAWPALERVAIGGGGHGVNLHVAGRELVAAVGAEVAAVTRDGSG